jgi:hypothetical protein
MSQLHVAVKSPTEGDDKDKWLTECHCVNMEPKHQCCLPADHSLYPEIPRRCLTIPPVLSPKTGRVHIVVSGQKPEQVNKQKGQGVFG